MMLRAVSCCLLLSLLSAAAATPFAGKKKQPYVEGDRFEFAAHDLEGRAVGVRPPFADSFGQEGA